MKLVLALFALLLAGDAAAGARARFDHALRSTKDARATFTQVRTDALGATTTKGTLEYRKPRRMRFDWQGMVPATAWVDRDTVWFYQPGEKQVLRSRASAGGAPPALFLEESVDVLEKSFTLKEDGEYGLVLTPRRPGQFSRLVLTLDPATGWPRRLVLESGKEGGTRLDFGPFKVNKGMASVRLAPTWPKGTTVVEL